MRLHHRHLRNIDCLSFVMCWLLGPVLIVNRLLFFLFFFCCGQLLKQTRQAVCAVKQSILLRCLWAPFTEMARSEEVGCQQKEFRFHFETVFQAGISSLVSRTQDDQFK
jgi:hypothetical protein